MVEGNRASYAAAKNELDGEKTFGHRHHLCPACHGLHGPSGHLQQAQDNAAKRLLDEVAAIRKVNVENFVAAYAFAAIPARFALERGDWKQAAVL